MYVAFGLKSREKSRSYILGTLTHNSRMAGGEFIITPSSDPGTGNYVNFHCN